MTRTLPHLFAAALLATLATGARAYDLTVEVLDARSTQGTVDAALYGAQSDWMHTPLQGQRAAAAPKVVLTYHDLPAGRYAVAAYHDENGNGKLDRNIAGIPSEPYGFSRDAPTQFGPPKFDAAAVDVNADTTIQIHLH